ncbi:hypothetical protein [Phycicoccus sp. Soil748]|uniref:hypothetical protein n=1 Tax=Phycicoccus sp. Soil748 TaxID=1736397 RepID=UPI0012E35BE2|nr:hypothetical protein [Phycicoccus sp. Soil748]
MEEESGTSERWVHPHNGYYAGDFSQPRDRQQVRAARDVETPTMRVLVLATGGSVMTW